jgi:CheY-like chemotaxis protein
MHIIIAEKNVDGRNMLHRLLKTEGYKVSIAESGSHALTLLKKGHTNIVLMNVFDRMCSSDAEPKLAIRQFGADNPALLVTDGVEVPQLDEFESFGNLCCATVLELQQAKRKNSEASWVLQMCSALRQSRLPSRPLGDFNWKRFNLLMHLPTDAYLGCRFLR